MKITNKHNLSEAVVRAIQRDWYSGTGETRDYSVTQLLNPPKLIHLTKRHFDELEEDVSERIFMLMGSAMHAILERANEQDIEFRIIERTRKFFELLYDGKVSGTPSEIESKYISFMLEIAPENNALGKMLSNINNDRYLIEKRFRYTTSSGKIITGGIDLYDKEERILHDYKWTSVYTWIYRNRPGSRKEEWTEQLNMYRLFMEKMGYPVDKLCINLLFRDFSKSKAKIDHSYPYAVETIELPLLGLDVVEQMIENKIAQLEKYNGYSDNAIPECNSHERWQGQDTWAVKKQGNKTASKVEFSYAAAKSYMEAEIQKMAEKDIAKNVDPTVAYERAKKIFYIEKREAIPTRCIDYCPVNKFCNFYQSLPEKIRNES